MVAQSTGANFLRKQLNLCKNLKSNVSFLAIEKQKLRQLQQILESTVYLEFLNMKL